MVRYMIYHPRTPAAVADLYVVRFNKSASELMDGLDKVEVVRDGRDFVIRPGKDLLLRRYGGGVRINSRALAKDMEDEVYTVEKEEGGVRLCPER